MVDAARVALLGTGLIGGSIGLALRAGDGGPQVVGFDPDRGAAAGALERGAIDAIADDPAAAVAGAELVVLCLPVDRIPQMCWSLGHAVDPEAVITDVGSAKGQVVAEAEAVFGGRFVGGHPMAGSERRGIDAADAALFEDAYWVLTPTETTGSEAYEVVAGLARATGAVPVAVDPATHDALVALVSHLPQITASALVDVAASSAAKEALLGLAGGGFRDVTRIAASDPDLWVAILRSNRAAVLGALDTFGSRLADVGRMIARDRWDDLRALLEGARSQRTELFAKPVPAAEDEPFGLSVVVDDRPGVLAEVTTAAGELGVNIEDLRIVHSTEGGRGRLELVVGGAPAAEELVGALEALGYRVDRVHL